MRCSVIIPCHNGAELTRDCVESLLAQRGPAELELEILLVDNASEDDTASLANLHPTVRCLRQPTNLGFAGGVNVGLRAAQHPIVVVLNNDTQAASNLLGELHRALVSDPRIGAVAPVSNFVKGAAALAIGPGTSQRQVREDVAAALQETQGDRVQDVDTLSGLCLMLRRETLAEVGLFDERFGNGNFEDDDLCLRLRLAGHRLVIARAAYLHHEGHATFRALGLDIEGQLHKRREQFVAKWRSDPAGRAVLAAQQGDLATAANEAGEARSRWPQWPDAHWHLGRYFAARGNHSGAAEHFAALLRACPTHPEAALELAVCRLKGGDPAAAQRQLAWASEHCHLADTMLAGTLSRIGEHWHEQGLWGAAADCFRDALQLTPEDGALHNWLGSCLLQQDQLETALASFEAAIARDTPLAHTNLAICEFRRGNTDRAAEHFARACELLPDDPVAIANYDAFRGRFAQNR